MQLLRKYQINIITEVVVTQMLSDFRREQETYSEDVYKQIVNHLRFTIAAKLSLMIVEHYDDVITKVKEGITPELIIADIIL